MLNKDISPTSDSSLTSKEGGETKKLDDLEEKVREGQDKLQNLMYGETTDDKLSSLGDAIKRTKAEDDNERWNAYDDIGRLLRILTDEDAKLVCAVTLLGALSDTDYHTQMLGETAVKDFLRVCKSDRHKGLLAEQLIQLIEQDSPHGYLLNDLELLVGSIQDDVVREVILQRFPKDGASCWMSMPQKRFCQILEKLISGFKDENLKQKYNGLLTRTIEITRKVGDKDAEG